MLNTFERFFERVDDEPEHAPHLTEKSSCKLANSLGNQNGRISVCHGGGNVALLVDGEKSKVQQGEDLPL